MWKTTLALVFCLVPATVWSADRYVDIEQRLSAEQVRAVGLTQTQLDLLNRMLREASQQPAAVSNGPVEEEPGRAYIGLDDTPIKSRLVGSTSGWEPGTVFVLANGQQWKVLKGRMKLPHALTTPEVTVVPGIAGRWFMQVDEDTPKPRVYRID